MASGYYVRSQATARVRTANQCYPFPTPNAAYPSGATGGVDRITCFNAIVTAAEQNAGTIYLFFPTITAGATRPQKAVLGRETTGIPLTKGQSVSFTGPSVGNGNQRMLAFGTGISYFFGSATSQRLIMTWDQRV